MTGHPEVAVVVIGRNEGQRLVACLESLAAENAVLVYVDSGSDDDSVANARDAGAIVVELDTSVPFTAARARNAGFEALEAGARPEFVQFVDGDCVVSTGWITTAMRALVENPDYGIVTGWRTEIHPDASIFNDLCEFEWHRPAGEIEACGGDMMVRSKVFEQVGGFNPQVIAAEDDEFCVRVRKAGWLAWRLPVNMTRHDAAMTRFAQWWQRAVRSGHGFAQVGALHPDYFVKERRRVLLFGALLPLLILIGLATVPWVATLAIALYAVSFLRTFRGLQGQGLDFARARHHAVYLTLSKFPNFQGMMIYHWRRFRRRNMNIIEYK